MNLSQQSAYFPESELDAHCFHYRKFSFWKAAPLLCPLSLHSSLTRCCSGFQAQPMVRLPSTEMPARYAHGPDASSLCVEDMCNLDNIYLHLALENLSFVKFSRARTVCSGPEIWPTYLTVACCLLLPSQLPAPRLFLCPLAGTWVIAHPRCLAFPDARPSTPSDLPSHYLFLEM